LNREYELEFTKTILIIVMLALKTSRYFMVEPQQIWSFKLPHPSSVFPDLTKTKLNTKTDVAHKEKYLS